MWVWAPAVSERCWRDNPSSPSLPKNAPPRNTTGSPRDGARIHVGDGVVADQYCGHQVLGQARAEAQPAHQLICIVTIDQADLCTTTTVTASSSYSRDRLWLNGVEEDAENNKRVQRVLKEVRAQEPATSRTPTAA